MNTLEQSYKLHYLLNMAQTRVDYVLKILLDTQVLNLDNASFQGVNENEPSVQLTHFLTHVLWA